MGEATLPSLRTTSERLCSSELPPRFVQPAARIPIGDLAIDSYSEQELIDSVLQHARHGNETRQIATANAQFFVLAEKNTRFRRCLEKAEYICADGMPLAWACGRFAGTYVPRITGVDFIERLCEQGAADGLRVYLLGGRPGTAAATGEVLRKRYPGTIVAGTSCPEFGFEKDPAQLSTVLKDITESRAQVIFVGLGAPKQEFFISQHVRPLGVPIAVGVGGSFEIISGVLARAPEWTKQIGLEWGYRLVKEPRRLWKRYTFGNIAFLWGLAKWRLRQPRVASTFAADIRG